MWERSILKQNAKLALRGRWGLAIAVSLLASIFTGIGVSGSNLQVQVRQIVNYTMPWPQAQAFLGVLLFLASIAGLVGIFIGLPVQVGSARFYVRNHFGEGRFGTLFSGFGPGYGSTLGAMFATNLFIALWTMLFIIPGIYKSYQYRFVPYLLSDNPHLTGSRAREISRSMTDGHKFSMFVLDLSYILWSLPAFALMLAGVTAATAIAMTARDYTERQLLITLLSYVVTSASAFLVSLFLKPYIDATLAELYIHLRDRGIEYHMFDPAELGLAPAAEAAPAYAVPAYAAPPQAWTQAQAPPQAYRPYAPPDGTYVSPAVGQRRAPAAGGAPCRPSAGPAHREISRSELYDERSDRND